MKRKQALLLFLLLLVAIVAIPLAVQADVGRGADYGTNNWGGNLGGGGDFSGGSGVLGINPFFLFGIMNNPYGIVILLALIAFRVWSLRQNTGNSRQNMNTVPNSARPHLHEENLQQLIEKDPHFSKQDFLNRVQDIFIALQQAWTAKNWRAIRPYESNRLYAQHERQLEQLIASQQTNVVEDISILNATIESYEEDHDNEYLTAILEARYRDYVIDDQTQNVLQGDKNRRYIMTYRMQFMRQRGVKTENSTETSVTSCPNCGAPLSINQNGICDYCGSEVTTGAHQWVLTNLQPLQQRVA